MQYNKSHSLIILLVLLGIFSINTTAFADSWQSTCPVTYCLDTSHGFTIDNYNTIVNWNQELYLSSYTQYSDHIFFNSPSFGNPQAPVTSFGVASQNINATVTQITNNLAEIDTATIPTKAANIFIYYTGAAFTSVQTVSGGNPTTFNQPDMLLTSSGYSSCTAPCAELNSSQSFIEIKDPAGVLTQNLVYYASSPGSSGGGGGGGGGNSGGSTSIYTYTSNQTTLTSTVIVNPPVSNSTQYNVAGIIPYVAVGSFIVAILGGLVLVIHRNMDTEVDSKGVRFKRKRVVRKH